MPDTQQATTGGHTHALDAAQRLRQRLTELGLPPDQIRQIVPVSDIERRTSVRMGTWSATSVETLLTALGGQS